MKRLISIAALLAALTCLFLVTGCGGNDGGSNIPTNNYTIGVYNADGPVPGAMQEIDSSSDGTSWTAYPGMLYFELILAGRKRGGMYVPADFVLYRSDEPQNYDNPAADLATFKQVKVLEEKTSYQYDFITAGRYLVKAFFTGTGNEITHIRLTIAPPPPPDDSGKSRHHKK